jgi:hypothetical protein
MGSAAFVATIILTLVVIVYLLRRRRPGAQAGFTDVGAAKKKECKRVCPQGEECAIDDGKEWCHKHAADEKDPWNTPGSPPARLQTFPA